ncbi:hypothetical protein QBC36DRAFT_319051 [Triangularia setosa]|uniref:Uncharacterized protein n=1 Tax=Triangularia setosa TaxID=2587417 RepID=A0AAN6WFZ0_9PEZI|nr:hypothetical protein QBC36DRAFT_319051 [Podospora setosa]
MRTEVGVVRNFRVKVVRWMIFWFCSAGVSPTRSEVVGFCWLLLGCKSRLGSSSGFVAGFGRKGRVACHVLVAKGGVRGRRITVSVDEVVDAVDDERVRDSLTVSVDDERASDWTMVVVQDERNQGSKVMIESLSDPFGRS